MQPPSIYTDAAWDWYVEHVCAIEVLEAMLARIGRQRGARMLDIGCGYGFALDLGRALHGWQGIGLDPSIAAERGRVELGLDIRSGTLDDAFAEGETFGVIFASEVLEHVPDPRSFLAGVHQRLADDGVFLLTTPDAAVVKPETPLTVLYPALSVGAHEFLVDADGLTTMLEDAGFLADVRSDGAGLRALATRNRRAMRSTRPRAHADLLPLIRYCADRAASAEDGSALELGMRVRELKFAVRAGAYRRATAALPGLRRALAGRYGVDLDDPSSALVLEDPTSGIAVGFQAAAQVAWEHQRDHTRAAELLRVAAELVRRRRVVDGEYRDPESATIEVESLGLRAFLLATVDPPEADRSLAALDLAVSNGATDAARARMYRERVVSVLDGSVVQRAKLAARRRAGRLSRFSKRYAYHVVALATRGRPSSGRRASGEGRVGAAHSVSPPPASR